jgi:predicted porin
VQARPCSPAFTFAAAEGGFTLVDGDKGSLSIYGTLDGGLLSRSGENGAYAAQAGTRFAGHKSELASGIESESRIGLKGSRDLRNGITALFQLEAGIAIDDGKSTLSDAEGNSVFRRKSFVGLAGSMGTVVFGRIDGGRYSVAGKYDLRQRHGGQHGLHPGAGTRADNAVAYISPPGTACPSWRPTPPAWWARRARATRATGACGPSSRPTRRAGWT